MNGFFVTIAQQSLTDHLHIDSQSSINNTSEKFKNCNSIINTKRNVKDGTISDFQPINECCIIQMLDTSNSKHSQGHDVIDTNS